MWIEISTPVPSIIRTCVTPLAGVWIEIVYGEMRSRKDHVTPLAGVWIEIDLEKQIAQAGNGHSPCGSVD